MRFACLAHVHDKLSGQKGLRVVEVTAEDRDGAAAAALAELGQTIGNVTIRAIIENPRPLGSAPMPPRGPLPRVRALRQDYHARAYRAARA